MTVGELERRMTGRELAEWRGFYDLEPFGAWRQDFNAALVAASNIWPHQGKHAEPVSPIKLMPLWDRPEPDPDSEAMKMRAFFESIEGRVFTPKPRKH